MYKKLSIHEFRENLVERHGKKFLEDMDSIFQGKRTLKSISDEYGLSKMRITQLFERLYGKRLRDVKKVGFAIDSSGWVFSYEKTIRKKLIADLPEWLHDELKKEAQRTGKAMSDVVMKAIIAYLAPSSELERYKRLFI